MSLANYEILKKDPRLGHFYFDFKNVTTFKFKYSEYNANPFMDMTEYCISSDVNIT